MKIIAKNTSLVFQVVQEPEVVPMTNKAANRLYTQIFSKAEFENYKYILSDYVNYEVILGGSNDSSMSGETFIGNWTTNINWNNVIDKTKAYYRITCRKKNEGNLSPSDVTLYKKVISV